MYGIDAQCPAALLNWSGLTERADLSACEGEKKKKNNCCQKRSRPLPMRLTHSTSFFSSQAVFALCVALCVGLSTPSVFWSPGPVGGLGRSGVGLYGRPPGALLAFGGTAPQQCPRRLERRGGRSRKKKKRERKVHDKENGIASMERKACCQKAAQTTR